VKLLALTLGFDEKFAIRAFLRAGLSFGDKAVIFLAEPLDERAVKAWRIVEDIVSKYFSGVNVETVKVNVSEFYSAVSTIAEKLKEASEGVNEIVVNLSGGMRILILEVLVATHLLGLKATVEVEFENFLGLAKFPLELLRTVLEVKEKLILKYIVAKGQTTITNISKDLRISKTTAHRKTWKLAKQGLLKMERKGRIVKCEPTEQGKLLATIAELTRKQSSKRENKGELT